MSPRSQRRAEPWAPYGVTCGLAWRIQPCSLTVSSGLGAQQQPAPDVQFEEPLGPEQAGVRPQLGCQWHLDSAGGLLSFKYGLSGEKNSRSRG